MGELQRHRYVTLGASLIGRVIGDCVWATFRERQINKYTDKRQFRQTIFNFSSLYYHFSFSIFLHFEVSVPQIAYHGNLTRTFVAPIVLISILLLKSILYR